MPNVTDTIFNQFLELVELQADGSCCTFDRCAFDHCVFEKVGHRLLVVIFKSYDECCRERHVDAIIDITGICFDDLITCKWVSYLEKIATQFVHEICDPIIQVVPRHKYCRQEPPRCTLPVCELTTYVTKWEKPCKQERKPKVITCHSCECVPECPREPCCGNHTICIHHRKENHCEASVPLKKHKSGHDWDTHQGVIDYNNHLWSRECKGCKLRC